MSMIVISILFLVFQNRDLGDYVFEQNNKVVVSFISFFPQLIDKRGTNPTKQIPKNKNSSLPLPRF